MKQLFFFITLFFSATTFAQSGVDGLRYSYLQQGGGTGRTMGIAGAGGALGADFSAVSINPAGLAAFRTSEFVITTGYFNTNTNAKLGGEASNKSIGERTSKFHLNNLGFVGSNRASKSKWTTKNWAIGYNRVANFNSDFYFSGKSKGSLMNRFLENANFSQNEGQDLDAFEEGLASAVNALYADNQTNNYTSDFDGNASNAILEKQQEGTVRGQVNEISFSYGANYKEKLLIGASLNLPFVNFTENKTYQEDDAESIDGKQQGNVPYFKQLIFKEKLVQSGSGVNAKLGLIFKPTQALRIGVAAQTPTVYSMSDNFSTSFVYHYIDKTTTTPSAEEKSPDGSFQYSLRTPGKITASAAYLFGRKGFLSADVDYVDYTEMSFNYTDEKDAEIAVNQSIVDNYKPAVNVRLGAEMAVDIFRFRAGVATLGLPSVAYENEGYLSAATKMYSAGIGIRENRFYADLGYQLTRTSDTYSPYLVTSAYQQPSVNRSKTASQYVLTFGFKF